jgi:hypothetical protein
METRASGQVLALKNYVLAFEAYQDARLLYDQYTFDPTGPFEETRDHMEELNRLRLVYVDAMNLKNVLYRVLKQMIGQGLE